MLQEKIDNGIDDPLYTSQRDEPPAIVNTKTFTEVEPINMILKPSLIMPQTINPDKIILQPDLTQVPEKLPLIIDETKLSKAFPVDRASQIISDIENEVPLSEGVTKILIGRHIIKEATPAETVEAIQVVPANKNPLNMGQLPFDPETGKTILPPKIIKVNAPVKGGIINSITDFIYKLIYV